MNEFQKIRRSMYKGCIEEVGTDLPLSAKSTPYLKLLPNSNYNINAGSLPSCFCQPHHTADYSESTSSNDITQCYSKITFDICCINNINDSRTALIFTTTDNYNNNEKFASNVTLMLQNTNLILEITDSNGSTASHSLPANFEKGVWYTIVLSHCIHGAKISSDISRKHYSEFKLNYYNRDEYLNPDLIDIIPINELIAFTDQNVESSYIGGKTEIYWPNKFGDLSTDSTTLFGPICIYKNTNTDKGLSNRNKLEEMYAKYAMYINIQLANSDINTSPIYYLVFVNEATHKPVKMLKNFQSYAYYDIGEYKYLPNAYQEVEYIESTGSQSIDSGIKLKNGSKTTIISDVQFTWNDTRQLIGFNTGSHAYWGRRDTTHFEIGTETPYLDIDVRDRHLVSYSIDVTTDGKSIASLNIDKLPNSYSYYNGKYTSGSYNLFSIGGGYKSSLKLFSCKIYEDNIILRNFIPCYRKIDNSIGLYDIVSDSFFTDVGFKKGSEINSDEDYTISQVIDEPLRNYQIYGNNVNPAIPSESSASEYFINNFKPISLGEYCANIIDIKALCNMSDSNCTYLKESNIIIRPKGYQEDYAYFDLPFTEPTKLRISCNVKWFNVVDNRTFCNFVIYFSDGTNTSMSKRISTTDNNLYITRDIIDNKIPIRFAIGGWQYNSGYVELSNLSVVQLADDNESIKKVLYGRYIEIPFKKKINDLAINNFLEPIQVKVNSQYANHGYLARLKLEKTYTISFDYKILENNNETICFGIGCGSTNQYNSDIISSMPYPNQELNEWHTVTKTFNRGTHASTYTNLAMRFLRQNEVEGTKRIQIRNFKVVEGNILEEEKMYSQYILLGSRDPLRNDLFKTNADNNFKSDYIDFKNKQIVRNIATYEFSGEDNEDETYSLGSDPSTLYITVVGNKLPALLSYGSNYSDLNTKLQITFNGTANTSTVKIQNLRDQLHLSSSLSNEALLTAYKNQLKQCKNNGAPFTVYGRRNSSFYESFPECPELTIIESVDFEIGTPRSGITEQVYTPIVTRDSAKLLTSENNYLVINEINPETIVKASHYKMDIYVK